MSHLVLGIILVIFAVWFFISAVAVVGTIGKERKPVTAASAMRVLVIMLAVDAVIVWAAATIL